MAIKGEKQLAIVVPYLGTIIVTRSNDTFTVWAEGGEIYTTLMAGKRKKQFAVHRVPYLRALIYFAQFTNLKYRSVRDYRNYASAVRTEGGRSDKRGRRGAG